VLNFYPSPAFNMSQQVSGELVQILRGTLSERSEVRREAENVFLGQWVPRPSELFPQLVSILLGTGQFSPEEQSLAAVFFRRWINRESSNDSGKKIDKCGLFLFSCRNGSMDRIIW
jgi:hypothetical protein